MLSCVEEFVESTFDGASCSRKHVACHFSDGGEVDTIVDYPYHSGRRAGIDVTVAHPLSSSYVTESAAQDGLHNLRCAEAEKERRHREQCKAAGLEYHSVVFTPYGGVHVMTDVFEPYFRVAACTACGSRTICASVRGRKSNGSEPAACAL